MQELFHGVDWKQTFLLNSLRAFFAGVVFTVLILINPTPGQGVGDVLIVLFGMVFFYWIILFPVGYLAAKLSEMGIPFIGIISFMFSIIIVLGDPFVFVLKLLNKKLPINLPISPDFAPVNFCIIFLTLREDVNQTHTI